MSQRLQVRTASKVSLPCWDLRHTRAGFNVIASSSTPLEHQQQQQQQQQQQHQQQHQHYNTMSCSVHSLHYIHLVLQKTPAFTKRHIQTKQGFSPGPQGYTGKRGEEGVNIQR
ncbi:hypothetical protein ElyMa_003182300 [Elysia marginata]|uniref:G-patch domain-containing protein n=1 Tax=Elysia marginata TaxID=1093978 RepID=A0AAV4IZ05_9GAST|nr:hypothetical protein ElyMa_003182300 [Elysia marginata]